MESTQFGLNQQSPQMQERDLQLFLNPRKSKSDDLFLGKLLINRSEMQRRPLLFQIPKQQNNSIKQQGISVFRPKLKKIKKIKECDYRKNICGYITKKIIREFLGKTFEKKVIGLCIKHKSQYHECRTYYLKEIEHITGPSHISSLLKPADNQQKNIKQTFKQFFEWFLKERYLRYILLQGKMTNKSAYIDYKNSFLLPLINKKQQDNVKAQIISQQDQPSFSQEQQQQQSKND